MMGNITRRRLLRKWRMKKIAFYIISAIVIIIGAILTAKGIFSDPFVKPYQLITGMAFCIAGVFSMIDTYHWKYKDFISKKMKKAR